MFDLLIYIIYTAYNNTVYDTPALHTSQTRIAFATTVSFAGGVFVNYLFVANCGFYRKFLDDYNWLLVPVTIIYAFIVHQPFAKRYTDKKIEDIAAKYPDRLPVSGARFLAFLHCLIFVLIVVMLYVETIYAFGR